MTKIVDTSMRYQENKYLYHFNQPVITWLVGVHRYLSEKNSENIDEKTKIHLK